jgi:hypothetical protein
MAVEDLKAMVDKGEPVQIVDATPKHFVARRQEMMVGASGAITSRCRNGSAN